MLEEALGFGSKQEGKKGKRGGKEGKKEEKFTIPRGLTGGDFRRLTEAGDVEHVDKGKVISGEGLEV